MLLSTKWAQRVGAEDVWLPGNRGFQLPLRRTINNLALVSPWGDLARKNWSPGATLQETGIGGNGTENSLKISGDLLYRVRWTPQRS